MSEQVSSPASSTTTSTTTVEVVPPNVTATRSIINENRHVVPMLILGLALLAAIVTMALTNHEVPNTFYDAFIGLSFAIAGVSVPPKG